MQSEEAEEDLERKEDMELDKNDCKLQVSQRSLQWKENTMLE